MDNITGNLHFILVFLEGILSFFSPCVLPLLPIYLSYLAGGAKQTDAQGNITYRRGKVFFHTLFFVLGISFAFFILGLSFSALGGFFSRNRLLFSRISGVLIILFGLLQLGILRVPFLQKEQRISLPFSLQSMNPAVAFLLGFTFSFAWTPCIGPMLSSVLILASGAQSGLYGNILVLCYTLGFVIPFLLVGLFTARALNFIRTKQKLFRYTLQAGGVILIIMGVMTLTGWMNGFTSYLSSFGGANLSLSQESDTTPQVRYAVDTTQPSAESAESEETAPAPAATSEETDTDSSFFGDFTLTDQYGNTHTLSDYKGKVIVLNFWTTWCGYCKQEMPALEKLYQQYGYNQEDVVILGVANPKTEENRYAQDVSQEEITAFLEENGYTFPVVFDTTSDVYMEYGISSFPTTFFFDRNGAIFGYAPGAMTEDMMVNAIEQAMAVELTENATTDTQEES